MKPSRIFLIAVIIICAAGTALRLRADSSSPPETQDIEIFQKVFPGAHSFRRAASGHPVYEALDAGQKFLGYAVFTADIVRDIQGHGGPIELAVAVDHKGILLGADVIRHQETPAYVKGLPEFLKQIHGIPAKVPLELGENIDGISGATITSTAVIRTINQTCQKIYSDIRIQPQKKPLPDPKKICAGLFLVILAVLCGILRKKQLRWICLLCSFVLLGLISKEMLSISHISGIILGQLPAWQQNPLLYILLFTALLGSLCLGRIFCARICPFAFVQEILPVIRLKFSTSHLSPNDKTDRFCRWIKYIVLILILGICVITQNSGIGALEVYLTLFTAKGSFPAWTLLIIVLAASFFFLRFWCRYLCPLGALQALLAQFQIFKKLNPCASSLSCDDSAECFYGERCLRNNFSKSTKKQNTAFLVLVILSAGLFAVSLLEAIHTSVLSTQPQAQKMLAGTGPETYSDMDQIRKKIHAAGLRPHPAKYWRPVEE